MILSGYMLCRLWLWNVAFKLVILTVVLFIKVTEKLNAHNGSRG